MKSISGALQAHLAQSVTTLCTCWKITRTDGQVFAFTDHDQPLTIEGVVYKSQDSFTRTSVSVGEAMAVDNMEVVGVLDDDSISEHDLRLGLFNYAAVQVFLCNWTDLSMGTLALRGGWLGEITVAPTGVYKTEIRSLTQALTAFLGDSFLPICRADLGDGRCTIPILPATWTPGEAVTVGQYVSDPAPADDAHALASYQCTTAGNTGAEPPAFNPTVGATTTESTGVVWTSMQPFRGMGVVTAVSSTSPTSNCTLTDVSYAPGGDEFTGTVFIQNKQEWINSGIGVTITVDGTVYTFYSPQAFQPWDYATWLAAAINASNAAGGIPCTASAGNTAAGVMYTIISKVDPYQSADMQLFTVTGSHGDPTSKYLQIENFAGAGTPGDPYLQGGIVTWQTGQNAGRSMEIKYYVYSTGELQLFLGMPYPIAVGDKLYWCPGCDKRRETCFFRFNNMLNFRGEPDMAGEGALLSAT
jgi:hypothetical protein